MSGAKKSIATIERSHLDGIKNAAQWPRFFMSAMRSAFLGHILRPAQELCHFFLKRIDIHRKARDLLAQLIAARRRRARGFHQCF